MVAVHLLQRLFAHSGHMPKKSVELKFTTASVPSGHLHTKGNEKYSKILEITSAPSTLWYTAIWLQDSLFKSGPDVRCHCSAVCENGVSISYQKLIADAIPKYGVLTSVTSLKPNSLPCILQLRSRINNLRVTFQKTWMFKFWMPAEVSGTRER